MRRLSTPTIPYLFLRSRRRRSQVGVGHAREAPKPPAEDAIAKFKEAQPQTWLADFADRLQATDFNAVALEAASRAFADEKTVKFKHLVGAVRVGLSGLTVTPGLFETLELLGKDESVNRLKASLGWA